MLYFDVIVHEQRVVVKERTRSHEMYDVSASVDGEIWRYRIQKNKLSRLPVGWRERGYQQAYYHAKNSGYNVKFHEVHYVKPKRKSKIHDNQLKLF